MQRKIPEETDLYSPFGRYTDNDSEETNEDVEEIFEDFEEKPPKGKSTKRKNKTTCEDEEIPPLWTGQTTVLDVIAPTTVDNGSRDYVVVDGIYHAYLYITGYGYRTHNTAAWLSSLVEAGDNIGISFTFKRMPRDKILSRIA